MHVIHKIQFFEEFLYYFALFFKKLIFSEFRPIKIVFRLTEIAIKNVCESLSVSIDARLVSDQSKHFWLIESVFQTIKNRVENFFKNWFSRVQIHFFKSCSTFSLSLSLSLSLYTTRSRLQSEFLSFSSILFARFSSPKANKTFIPFLLLLFSFFMHQIMHYLGNFKPIKF